MKEVPPRCDSYRAFLLPEPSHAPALRSLMPGSNERMITRQPVHMGIVGTLIGKGYKVPLLSLIHI